MGIVEQASAAFFLECLGLDPVQSHLQVVGEAAVKDRLVEALIRILVACVLADDVNRELVFRVFDAVDQRLPGRGARLGLGKMEQLQNDAIQS